MQAEQRDYYYQVFESAVDKIDIFAFFCETLTKVLSVNGRAGFVLSSSWLSNASFKAMRRIIFTKLRVSEIVLNPSDAFDANVETLNLLVNGTCTSYQGFVRLARLQPFGYADVIYDIPDPEVTLRPEYIIDVGGSKAHLRLLDKIEKGSIRLGDLAKVNYGLKTGDDPEFVSYQRQGENPKQVIYGEDVHAYSYHWRGLWVNYVPQKMIAHRATARPATADRFETVPKLTFKRISQGRLCVVLDTEGIYSTISTIVVVGFKANIEYIH
jgi:hypothetical protein